MSQPDLYGVNMRLAHNLNSVKISGMNRNQPPEERPADRYHHGDLRTALIRAADEILAEHGLEGFSLREAARRAGVSAAAPAHHFGGAAGLLSEVAVLGFQELAKNLQVDASQGTPTQRLRLQGMGYVRFAMTYPGRFQLMFRRDLLSPDHPALQEAGRRALLLLEETIRAIRSLPNQQPLDPQAQAALLATWSTVHGFAHLALDGKLAHLSAGAPLDDLLAQVLESQWPDP
ncbi:TetR family transcriptional regulator [Pseudoxanthomonas sacheonensis]|nr:TetR family transcriptional regulator [Pseudoxanthomonas sacheonensis]